MTRETTLGAVAPMELPAEPDPPPQSDLISVAAMTEIVENGFDQTTVDLVVRRAGVSRQEFDRRFESLEHCALDTFERTIAEFEIRVGTAFNEQPDWASGLRAAAYATADYLEENPLMGFFGMVDALRFPEEMVRVRREEAFDFCARMIDRGRSLAADPEALPESAATFAIGGITQLLAHRLQEGAEVDPRATVPEMMNRVVAIYLGAEAAEAEWTAEPPSASAAR